MARCVCQFCLQKFGSTVYVTFGIMGTLKGYFNEANNSGHCHPYSNVNAMRLLKRMQPRHELLSARVCRRLLETS
jgi:hypothetical protein